MPWKTVYLDTGRRESFGAPQITQRRFMEFGPTGESFTGIARQRLPSGGAGNYEAARLREQGRQFDIAEGNKQNRFNTLYGQLTAMMGSPGIDVDIERPPATPEGDVFSAEQIRETRNQEMAEALQGAQGRSARNRARMASRGVGNPLLELMEANLEQIAAGEGARRGLDFATQAATANAEQRTRSGVLAEEGYRDYMSNLLRKEEIKANRANALLAALANLGF